jgi:hypothetical protein
MTAAANQASGELSFLRIGGCPMRLSSQVAVREALQKIC